MTIEYIWKIKGIKVKDVNELKNVVVQTYWEKIGTDENDNTGTFSGATPFTLDESNTENFVQYENLTEEIVLGWIQSVVVDSYEEHVNNQIQKQINEKVNAVIEADMPWAVNQQ
jgi:hypothetical protein